MKRTLIFLLLQLVSIIVAISQDSITIINGQLVDKETQEGIDYVNIGVFNTPIGTISMGEGRFKLGINLHDYSDSILVISAIGYESVRMNISKIDTTETLFVHLIPKVYELDVVKIEGKKLKIKQYGVKKTGGGLIVGLLRGLEKAYYIPVKKDKCKIKKLNFCISEGNDTTIYRVNFYDHINQRPHNRIIEKNLIFTGISNEDGWIECDLSTEELYFGKDFYIAVEILPTIKNGIEKRSAFRAKIGGKGSLFTRDYYDVWEEIKGLGVPLYISYYQIGGKE